ncbi:MAG: hypothetical protein IKQ18_01255 [Clostridia bacterium]|nr:hypothetical protein [Clostridia bacterium]
MKNSIISRSLLLSFIGVILCISMFVGTTLAIFGITFDSDTNTVVSSAFNVTVKTSDNYDEESFTTDLDGTKLFNNITLLPGKKSDVKYIKIHNASGGNISVTVKITGAENGNNGWKYYCDSCQSLTEEKNPTISKDFDYSNDMQLYSGTIADGNEINLALAIGLATDYTILNSTLSFKINVVITQVS